MGYLNRIAASAGIFLLALSACNNTPDTIIIETPSVLATRVSRETIRLTVRPTLVATAIAATSRPTSPAANPTPRSAQASGKININTANADTLASLPRIGAVAAERIVTYRQQHGPFRRIDDLKNVNGIGEATFETIKDRVTVE